MQKGVPFSSSMSPLVTLWNKFFFIKFLGEDIFRKWAVSADVCQIAQKSVETVYFRKICQWVLPKISSYIPYLISLTADRSIVYLNVKTTQQPSDPFTCSNSTIETFEKVWNMKLTTKTPERHNWHHSGVIIVNSEYISQCIVGSSALVAVMNFFCLKFIFFKYCLKYAPWAPHKY